MHPIHYLHTRIRVHDLEASYRFYTEVLGFEEIARKPSPAGNQLVLLKLPGSETTIELAYSSQVQEFKVPEDLLHFCLRLPSIRRFRDEKEPQGVEFWPEQIQAEMYFLDDPDGYEVELLDLRQGDQPIFDHTRIRVKDLDQSIEFYTRVLGFEVLSRKPSPAGNTIVHMKLPGNQTLMELAYRPDYADFTVPEDLIHHAFSVPSLQGFREYWEPRGVSFWPSEPSERMYFIDDPNGYEIELLPHRE